MSTGMIEKDLQEAPFSPLSNPCTDKEFDARVCPNSLTDGIFVNVSSIDPSPCQGRAGLDGACTGSADHGTTGC